MVVGFKPEFEPRPEPEVGDTGCWFSSPYVSGPDARVVCTVTALREVSFREFDMVELRGMGTIPPSSLDSFLGGQVSLIALMSSLSEGVAPEVVLLLLPVEEFEDWEEVEERGPGRRECNGARMDGLGGVDWMGLRMIQ